MQRITKKRMNMFKGVVVMAGLSLFIIGCGGYDMQRLANKSLIYEYESKTLNTGIETYENGDIEKAADIFESLNAKSEDDGIRRRALYGLACTRLILAQTQEEYGDAVVLWGNWSQMRGTGLGNEDPRMCAPLFQRIFPTLPAVSASDTEESEDEDEEPDVDSEEPVSSSNIGESVKIGNTRQETCSGLLKGKEKEIQSLKASNAKMKNDIRILKDQINSLEAIHRKIQEKKKEIVP